jgi:hypothetical protein
MTYYGTEPLDQLCSHLLGRQASPKGAAAHVGLYIATVR